MRRSTVSWIGVLALLCLAALPAPAVETPGAQLDLTPEETAWLAEHPVIRFGPYSQYAPLEYVDENGVHRGLAADYVQSIESLLGITFEMVYTETWQELIDRTRAREIDVLGLIAKNDERSTYLSFNEPYVNLPAMILVRSGTVEKCTPRDLVGKQVGLAENYAVHDYFERYHPEVHLVTFPNATEGLRRLSMGGLDAFVSDLAEAGYYATQQGIANLHVAGDSGFTYRMGIASRNDWPLLHSILQKAGGAIPPETLAAMNDTWIDLKVYDQPNRRLQTVLAFSALAAGALALLVFTWNLVLRRQVKERTRELEQQLALHIANEEALEFNRVQLRTIIDLIPAMIYAKDVEGRFILANQSLADWYDVAVEDLVGHKQREFHSSATNEELDAIRKQDLSVIESGKSLSSLEDTFTNAKGERRHLRTAKISLERPGEAQRAILGVTEDVTQYREMLIELETYRTKLETLVKARTEQLEKARVKAEASSDQKGHLVARISHELRTPLNSIMGYSDLLIKGAIDETNQVAIDDLKKIHAAARNLNSLIDNLLDMSKFDAGVMDRHLEEFSLQDLIEDLRQAVTPDIDRNRNELVVDIEEGLTTMVSDRMRIWQILVNLISNAAKFTDKGTIRLEIRSEGSPTKRSLSFRVSDTGMGIEKSALAKIFLPFAQAHVPRNSSQKGTGLGLAICQSYADLLNGQIRVESTPGEGSTFIVDIPDAADTERG